MVNQDLHAQWVQRYEEWTSCEMYGHFYKDGSCIDCGEKHDDPAHSTPGLFQPGFLLKRQAE
jgi:hypothetical protein